MAREHLNSRRQIRVGEDYQASVTATEPALPASTAAGIAIWVPPPSSFTLAEDGGWMFFCRTTAVFITLSLALDGFVAHAAAGAARRVDRIEGERGG
jgi:hypothetical protein